MAERSVDDMYNGCRAEMTQMVGKKYKEEIKHFQEVWNNAKTCADRNALTKDHMQAICIYTAGGNTFYETFNEAVRTGREHYGTSFPYHSFHFLLTIAIQLLKENQEDCYTVYRRSDLLFTGNAGQIIRFGSFASSSLKSTLMDFGQVSCFKIKTCSGASFTIYSDAGGEDEVLIPPYEMFKIIYVITGKNVKYQPYFRDCTIIYFMESAGVQSNLNCKAADV
ncbi:hypothetical protein LDENG_00248030 [Lucifuga dentata]|nr:hypothetical protein LDENG_00248030 [Lucifuga dentata]